eukprot:SAG31_NODE_3475_length_4230_cov_3.659162_3_plen_359_part_00
MSPCSLTVAPAVNDGQPVILYSPSPSVPEGALAPRVGLGDRPIMAVARPAHPDDPELRHWNKDSLNPVAFADGRPVSDLGQIWKSGARWNALSNGAMFSSNTSSLHTWYYQKGARGFPRGGSGGQWFQQMPRTVEGAPPPPNLYLISTGNGEVYSSGYYFARNDTFRTQKENILLDVGTKNGRAAYSWAALQCSGQRSRCFTTAWISPAQASGASRFEPPASALSLVREVFYDPETEGLLVLPLRELSRLHNRTLFRASTAPLVPGKLFTPQLASGDAGAGTTIDINALFKIPASGPASFGISVLADSATLRDSTVVRINISAVDASTGVRTVTASGGKKLLSRFCANYSRNTGLLSR